MIALFEGTALLKERPFPGKEAGQNMAYFIQQTLEEAHLSLTEIGMIVVGIGPGSYTGMRVAVSIAQGLALAKRIPLIGLSSLKGFYSMSGQDALTLVDARIGGVYGMERKQGIFLDPVLFSLQDLEKRAGSLLVSPHVAVLQKRLAGSFQWEEVPFRPHFMMEEAYMRLERGEFLSKEPELLYLRPTQAEAELQAKGG
jgi:tRNA threonylcarbamoyl adenosine modification protein YeaZ